MLVPHYKVQMALQRWVDPSLLGTSIHQKNGLWLHVLQRQSAEILEKLHYNQICTLTSSIVMRLQCTVINPGSVRALTSAFVISGIVCSQKDFFRFSVDRFLTRTVTLMLYFRIFCVCGFDIMLILSPKL